MQNDALDAARRVAALMTADALARVRSRDRTAHGIIVGLVALVLLFGAICFYLGRISVEASSVRPLTIQSRIA